MTEILNQHAVSIEVYGRTVAGTYTTWAGIITVTALGRIKKALIGSLPPDHLAQIMLRELVNNAKTWWPD